MTTKKTILIGGSAGSFRIVTCIIASLPAGFSYPVVLCLHRLKNVRNGFAEALSVNNFLKISEPFDNEVIKNGMIYLAPSNYHLIINHNHGFCLSVDDPVNHSRPSIDVMFETAAEALGDKCIGILLSGANSDGARGMLKLKNAGAITIVQNPDSAEIPAMPRSCLNLFKPDHIMSPDEIITFLRELNP